MHGSSSVPQEWLAVINEFGGDIKETYGVPVEEIVEGIKHGVRKVNIDTDLRLASTGAIRQFMARNPSEFDPRKYLAKTVEAMREICIARYEAFGTAGNARRSSRCRWTSCSTVTPRASWTRRSADAPAAPKARLAGWKVGGWKAGRLDEKAFRPGLMSFTWLSQGLQA